MKTSHAILAVCVFASTMHMYAQEDGHDPFQRPITAAKIQTAIDDAIQYLRNQQLPDGSIGDNPGRDHTGSTALAALAMLAAGKHPGNYEPLRKALDYVMAHEPKGTYARAVRANTWEYALRKDPNNERIKAALTVDCIWLQQSLGEKMGWRYEMNSSDWDNSATQYGVLGLWAGARAGHELSPAFWRTMAKHFLSCQNEDGGWGYMRDATEWNQNTRANMVTAGLATMFLVFDSYFGRTSYTTDNPRVFTDGPAAACLASLERGMTWLGQNAGNVNDGYYLYGIERAGVASGRKYFGGKDWFGEGVIVALEMQQADGSFGVPPNVTWTYEAAAPGPAVVQAAFNSLFLIYGGAPVAFNKLEYGNREDWNLNPRDLANLTKQMWYAYEKPLNWHSVSLSAPAHEFEAPILVITGSTATEFSEAEVAKLREYIDRGGLILAEPSDYSKKFRGSMEWFAERLYPEAALTELSTDHPIFNIVNDEWTKRPKLRGVSNGSRIVFVLSDDYMSAKWQENDTDADAFKLALNLLFYAIDNGELDPKYTSNLPTTPAAEARNDTLTVARVSIAGDAGKYTWQRFAPYLQHTTGYTVVEHDPVVLDPGELPDARLLHLTGRNAIDLSRKERKALKQYVEAGGTILIDAYAGSADFAESAKEQMTLIFGDFEALPNDHKIVKGAFPDGTDLSSGIRYKVAARRVLRDADLSTREQHLQVAYHDGRPAIIFSDLDLTSAVSGVRAFQCIGYKSETAMQILSNLSAYLLAL